MRRVLFAVVLFATPAIASAQQPFRWGYYNPYNGLGGWGASGPGYSYQFGVSPQQDYSINYSNYGRSPYGYSRKQWTPYRAPARPKYHTGFGAGFGRGF
jgi:hypothetical protein